MCNSNGIAGYIRLIQKTGEYMVMFIVLLSMQHKQSLFARAAISRFMWPGCCVSRLPFVCALGAGSRTCRIQATSSSAHASCTTSTCPLYGCFGVRIVSVSSLSSRQAILASLFAYKAKKSDQ